MTIKEIDETIEQGQSLKTIAQAYSEIANLKIKKIRAQVERNRLFFQEISKVYGLVKNLAALKKMTVVKPKKMVCLILTSNYRFYGRINSDLLQFFIKSTQNVDTDRIVVNRAAIEYFRAQPIFDNYQEILLRDDLPQPQELASLVNILKGYNQVLVFYSSMKTLARQQPTVSDITATSVLGTKSSDDFKFIFEPELPKILQFFDSSILTLLLESTFLESELSRTASRFISMDSAETGANNFIKQYQTLRAYTKRNLENNKILESFASLAARRASMMMDRKALYE